MKIILGVFFTFFLIVYLAGVWYLLIPSASFPKPPEGAVQSMEPADSETPTRRAYFTNLDREGVINHYKQQIAQAPFLMRLNYPPEDAQTIIRDQTRSAYLEELVQPLRDSIFVNGFIPSQAKDDIWYKGKHYEEKITIRYVTTSVILRTIIWTLSFIVGWFLLLGWIAGFKDLVLVVRNK